MWQFCLPLHQSVTLEYCTIMKDWTCHQTLLIPGSTINFLPSAVIMLTFTSEFIFGTNDDQAGCFCPSSWWQNSTFFASSTFPNRNQRILKNSLNKVQIEKDQHPPLLNVENKTQDIQILKNKCRNSIKHMFMVQQNSEHVQCVSKGLKYICLN